MKTHFSVVSVLLLLLILLPSYSFGNVRLPLLISDGMVLQRDTKLDIWGWASAGEKIIIKFNNKTFRTITDTDGKWKIIIPAMKAGGPYKMKVS
jgi:sialate O-acetylesterase